MWNVVPNFILSAIVAILGWLIFEFVGRPFRRFFDLRSEVARRLVQFNNVFARVRWAHGSLEFIELPPEEDARLTEAQHIFRDLGSQMQGFEQAEPFAVWIVSWRYDVSEASNALIGYSNEIATASELRELLKGNIERVLRIWARPANPTAQSG
jgi:hypothetical protein